MSAKQSKFQNHSLSNGYETNRPIILTMG